MEKFITEDVWKKVNDLISNSDKKKMISIAYVTSNSLKLTKGDILICDSSDYSIRNGQTSVDVLQEYLSQGVEIYSLEQLHSKFLVSDDFLIIGSANLSKNSAENLIESAVIMNSKVLIEEAIMFFSKLMTISENISTERIRELAKIPIKRLEETNQIIHNKREDLFRVSSAPFIREKYLLDVINVDIKFKNNKEYVILEVKQSGVLPGMGIKKQKKHIYDSEKVNEWIEARNKNSYLKIYGTIKWVSVQKHIAINDKYQRVSDELLVLVFCDKNGDLLENPFEVAMGKLSSKYYRLV